MNWFGKIRPRLQIGLAAFALVAALAIVLASPPRFIAQTQERVFDTVLLWASAPPQSQTSVRVVDIGALDEHGKPWSRAATARLMEAVAKANPKAVAFDMVFSGNCAPNGQNAALAMSLAKAPVALGFLMSARAAMPPRPGPDLAVSKAATGRMWASTGAESPCPAFAAASQGLGATALLADADGIVRRLPAAVLVGQVAYPSLAVEALRLANHSAALPVLAPDPAGLVLRLGPDLLKSDPAAQLRFAPSRRDIWAKRSNSATDLLAPGADLSALSGALVFIGSSLPQSGGLRATATSPIQPSVQIQADLAEAMLSGRLPYRDQRAALWEAGATLLLGLAAITMVLAFPVGAGVAATLALILAWLAASLAWFQTTGSLTDPVLPSLTLLSGAVLALTGKAILSARAERALRRKMAQLLPEAVVRRLADDPQLFKLRGEARVVTALMTDIEGFSETTRIIGPEALVTLLDSYFTLVCAAVLRHGGMIDKMVGDSVHALFNAPLDLANHADAALACAADIMLETEQLRQTAPMRDANLGRTRIGVESGPAVLGDVGSGAKIDYTAHGDAVNLAARLEALNKDLGTNICIGPGTAALAQTPLHSLGLVEIRSFGPREVFTLTNPS